MAHGEDPKKRRGGLLSNGEILCGRCAGGTVIWSGVLDNIFERDGSLGEISEEGDEIYDGTPYPERQRGRMALSGPWGDDEDVRFETGVVLYSETPGNSKIIFQE